MGINLITGNTPMSEKWKCNHCGGEMLPTYHTPTMEWHICDTCMGKKYELDE